MCSSELQECCKEDILKSTNYYKGLPFAASRLEKSSLQTKVRDSCSRKYRTHILSKKLE